MNINKPTIPMQGWGGEYFYPLTSGDQVIVDDKNKLLNNAKLNIDLIYPIGSIYMSMNDTDPSILFGGTWKGINGRFLLSSDSTYKVGTIGGEENHAHTIPFGFDKDTLYWYAKSESSIEPAYGSDVFQTSNSSLTSRFTYATGSWVRTAYTTKTNNMPPYLVVHMWERVS